MVRRRLDQAGDTIVEVLIAIAVLGGVLGISYKIINKNMQITRDSQERTEANKVAIGQIEAVKSQVQVNNPVVLSHMAVGQTNFCMDGSTLVDTGVVETIDFDLNNPEPVYPPACKQGMYDFIVEFHRGIGGPDVMRVFVRWDGIGGMGVNGREQVIYSYVP